MLDTRFWIERVARVVRFPILRPRYIHYIDEAHIDSDKTYSKRVLREEETRYEACNMQIMLDLKSVKLHFVVSIFWHYKSPLQFYNDEHDLSLVIIKKSFKSRRSRYLTEETHQQRIIEWKTSLSHDLKIKFKKNLMTQAFYTERLLPVYANLINEMLIQDDKYCILQEDNDNNHGTRSRDNVVVQFKTINWITTLFYSSQSSDLNSSEIVWNILKERVKKRQFRIVAKLKKVLLNEWDQIIMNEIRDRISDMSRRYKVLTDEKYDDEMIKSDKW
jgi:hypothetical protein